MTLVYLFTIYSASVVKSKTISVLTASKLGLADLEVGKLFADMSENGEIIEYFWEMSKNNLSTSRTSEHHSLHAVKKIIVPYYVILLLIEIYYNAVR